MPNDPFYSKEWPTEAEPYRHLEPYLQCWLQPERMFAGKRILDIGAGECVYTRLIAEKYHPKEIVALEQFRERMIPTLRVNQNQALKFIAGDCLDLPFLDGSFDFVWGNSILCDLYPFDQVVLEIRRVLKKDGRYVGWEPNPFNPVILYRYLFKPRSHKQHLFWPHRMRHIFEKHGFQVTIRYFYAKFPVLRDRFLGTCTGIIAERID